VRNPPINFAIVTQGKYVGMTINSNCRNNKLFVVYRKKACKTVYCSSRFHDINVRWILVVAYNWFGGVCGWSVGISLELLK